MAETVYDKKIIYLLLPRGFIKWNKINDAGRGGGVTPFLHFLTFFREKVIIIENS